MEYKTEVLFNYLVFSNLAKILTHRFSVTDNNWIHVQLIFSTDLFSNTIGIIERFQYILVLLQLIINYNLS